MDSAVFASFDRVQPPEVSGYVLEGTLSSRQAQVAQSHPVIASPVERQTEFVAQMTLAAAKACGIPADQLHGLVGGAIVTEQGSSGVVQSPNTGNHAHVPALVSQMNVHPAIVTDLLPALKSRGVLRAFATGTSDFPRLWLQVANLDVYDDVEGALLDFIRSDSDALFTYEILEPDDQVYAPNSQVPVEL